MGLSLKQLTFIKRTLTILVPIPIMAGGAKIFSDVSYNYKPIFYTLYSPTIVNASNSLSNLALTLTKNRNYPEGIEDYGSKLKTSSGYIIEQDNPFNPYMYSDEYSYKKVEITSNATSNAIEFNKSDNKYSLFFSNFEKSDLKGKGDLHLLVEYALNLDNKDINLTSAVPLDKLIYSENIESNLVSINKPTPKLILVSKTNNSFLHKLKISKKSESKKIEVEIDSPSSPSSVTIKNFYILFTDNPAQNPLLYFGSQDTQENTIKLRRGKRKHLSKWTNTSSPKFSFDPNDPNWTSVCWDHYKAGGFIDKKIEEKKESSTTTTGTTTGMNYIKKQKAKYELFQPQKITPQVKTQYSWSTNSGIKPNDFHPITEYTTPTPCEGVDKETHTLLNTYAKTQETLVNEKNEKIDTNLIPKPLNDLINKSSDSSSENPITSDKANLSRVIQASFAPWGGVYPKNPNTRIKPEGLFNQIYVDSIGSSHSFNLSIQKDEWEKNLIEHDSIKNLNSNPNISTLLTTYIPITFQIYDPIINFLRTEKLNLYIDLDLRSLYLNSNFQKRFYSYSITDNHKNIDFDYGGFKYGDHPSKYTDASQKKEAQEAQNRKKSYSYQGLVNFYAGLEIDSKSNLLINIVTEVTGFISTKNPTCDLRHRLYKWTSTDSNDSKCTQTSGWKQRKHNHIPPFLILSVDKDITLDTWMIDDRKPDAEVDSDSNSTNSLKKFKDEYSTRTTKKLINLSQHQNSEVFFKNINAADTSSYQDEKQYPRIASYSDYLSLSSQYWYAFYYIPRRNYGSFLIPSEENLEKVSIELEGSSTLSGRFFNSFHSNTVITSCTSSTSSKTTFDKECSDGTKYEKIHKDKKLSTWITENSSIEVNVDFNTLKTKTSESSSEEIIFLSIVHRESNESNESNGFDQQKDKYKKIFSDSDSPISLTSSIKDKVAQHSHIGAWYTIKIWYESSKKTINYLTELRVISVISGVADWKNSTNENKTLDKLPGSAGAAGFQLKSANLQFKSPSTSNQ